jgi:hypothetical protein
LIINSLFERINIEKSDSDFASEFIGIKLARNYFLVVDPVDNVVKS